MTKNPIQVAEVWDATEDAVYKAALDKALDHIQGLDRSKVRCMIATVVYKDPTEIDPENISIVFISAGTPEQISRMFLEHYNNSAEIINDLIASKEIASEEKH